MNIPKFHFVLLLLAFFAFSCSSDDENEIDTPIEMIIPGEGITEIKLGDT